MDSKITALATRAIVIIIIAGFGGWGVAAEVFDGYNLFSPIRSTDTYLIDNDGNVVHTWSSAYRPGLSVYLLEDSTLLRTANTGDSTFNVGGAGGRVEMIDWDGNLVWTFDYGSDVHRLHHDVEVLPNGNVLMIAWELKTEAEAMAAGRNPSLLSEGELWPDMIIELDPSGASGGTIVWEWHVWDHLIQDHDLTKANYGSVVDHPELIDLNYAHNPQADWNHINSIDYSSELDQIVLSVRNFSEIWIIDHSTSTAEAAGHTGGNSDRGGDLLYRWGNPQTYGAGTAGDQQLFVQHDAEWIEDGLPGAGNILVFNNGTGRPAGSYSSIDEIVPPLLADGSYESGLPFGPAAPAWTYQGSPMSDLYAERISGSQRLLNGNTLICDGPGGRFFEVTAGGDTVWEHEPGSDVFRVERYGLTYTGLDPQADSSRSYPIVDTGQDACFNTSSEITAPAAGAAFHGQDGQYHGNQPSYTTSADGLTVDDNHTGLTWVQSPDTNGDGDIDSSDKVTWADLPTYVDTLNAAGYGGYNDWRVPSIKELYSLIDFRGTDPSPEANDPSGLVPFIDTGYFAFGYGDTDAGERIIDAQYWSSTEYVFTTMSGNATAFGVNFADGRIKGYPRDGAMGGGARTQYIRCVRGNLDYGSNDLADNGDGTVTDHATGLMWQQADSGAGMTWEAALAYAEGLELAGHSDWRLPNAKELQSIIDYSRSPDTTGSAAIDPVFLATAISNENLAGDYPAFWTGTTHVSSSPVPGRAAAYLCFGRGMGYMSGSWLDVHGAGCQRSDPKEGELSDYTYVPYGYYFGNAPQGDAIRIANFVRCVRDAPQSATGIFADDFESGDTSAWSSTTF
jgi:hypothetical protein